MQDENIKSNKLLQPIMEENSNSPSDQNKADNTIHFTIEKVAGKVDCASPTIATETMSPFASRTPLSSATFKQILSRQDQ